MIQRILFIVLVSLPLAIFGQTAGKISGAITDTDGSPLAGANVIVEGTSLGVASNNDGEFVILNVPVGTYTLSCDYIGYSTLKISNVIVSANLTTTQDFKLAASAIAGDVVEVKAEKPIINKNSTNTTRLIGSETIENMPLRGVESIVAMQTGTVADDGNIYVRGSRAGDVAYYVDGVYMNNAYTLNNTSTVSNSAMEEVQFQSGGFSAEYGNVNGGVVNTSTKVGGSSIDVTGEFVQGLGSSGSGDKDELYSYGYNLYNLNVGGPIGEKIKFYVSYEGRSSDDSNPTKHSFYSMDRQELSWSRDSVAAVLDDPATEDVDESVDAYLGLTIDGNFVGDWADFEVAGAAFNTSLEGVASDSISGYSLIDVTSKVVGDTTESVVAAYSNNRAQYGAKPNSGSDRQTITGNLSFDLGALRLKVGGLLNSSSGRSYRHDYSLLNSANNPKWENNTLSMYANLAFAISDKSYIKINAASFKYTDEYGDNTYWDKYNDYGNTANSYLRSVGKNPIALQEFSYYSAYGTVYDDYDFNETSYISLKADYVNQMGDHEIKAGFDYRDNNIKYYRLAQPMEIAQEYEGAGAMPDDETWVFNTYRNAYAENLGCTVTGDCDATSGNGYTDPGNPVILGAYVQDKIELEDLIVNLGVRFDQFSPNTKAAKDWSDIWLKNGALDKDSSYYQDVDPYTYINPRLGFSFPVSDKTKIHAQYGKFTQHPILDRLYLSDTRLASNFTQGNMTVSPNPSLKPEQTTQYEVGLTQQVGGFAALGLTGFYKEIRDYTMMANVVDAKQNGALFNWAQYMNGDFGVVKGMSANLNMRRVNGLMANVSYTMSFAEGTGSDPASNFNIAWTGDTYPTMINPLEYDQRHTGSIMFDYRLNDKGSLFSNTGFNLLYQFGSGTAYTPSMTESAIFGRGWYAPTAAINSAYKPWTSTLDLRIDSDVKIGGLNASVYLLVLNVLDTDNVDEVYAGSGDAANDGYLNTLEGKTWATGNPDAVDFYNARLQDPRNWDAPRQVRVGLSFGL